MNHLFTPWRSPYIEKHRERSGCVFCAAAAETDDVKNLVVHRGTHSYIILNRYPYTTGHVMVAPYQHAARLSHLPEEISDEMMRFARRLEQIIELTYQPDGLNLGMNLGQAAGAGIEQHLHLHVLPRWSGDANFMSTIAETRILPELLEDTYLKLCKGWQAAS